jgi:hypothetical protein
MKKLKTIVGISLFTLCFISAVRAQPCRIQLHEVASTKSSEGNVLSKPGKELQQFRIPENENAVRLYIQLVVTDFAKMHTQNKLQVLVTSKEKVTEVEIHTWAWYSLTKNQTLTTDCYFPAGENTITVVDADNHKTIFAKRMITVQPRAEKEIGSSSDFPYRREQFKIWTCKNIDDNWKPIDVVTSIKAGECIQLFFESKDKIKNLGSMRWGIYKLTADGREEYINQKDQGIGQLDLWRRLSYEECDEFRIPGTYRIYISSKDDADAYYGVNNKNYFARTDLRVE